MLEQFTDVQAIGVVTGYIAGQGLDVLSTNKAKQVIGSISSSHEATAIAIEQDERLKTVSKNIGRRLLSPLALSGALTGALIASAFGPGPAKATIPANIEVIVDHSGMTSIDDTITEINSITNQFNGNSKFKSEAIVSGSGINIPMNTANVASNNPFGIATIDQALPQAVGQINSVDSSKNSPSHSGAILIVTDGNSVGSLAQAEALAAPTKIPIYTVDVSSGHSTASSDYKQLAKDTHAKFWKDPTPDQQSKIADTVYESLNVESAHGNITVQSNKDVLKVLSGLALAATGVLAWKRRYVMFDRDSSGK
jgi:hypothetical protein